MTLKFRIQVNTEMQVHIGIFKAAEALKTLANDAVKIAKLKTAVSELGQNVIKYAKEGTISVYEIDSPKKGIKVIVEDKGPGIADLNKAFEDHYSTSGTLGLGLPGVQRMVDDFSIKSEVGVGTVAEVTIYI